MPAPDPRPTGGLAQGAAVRRALAGAGVRVAGLRWLHRPGAKGGIFDPHAARDNIAVWNPEGFVGDNASEWGAIPGDGRSVNSRYCLCTYRLLLRGADGRFLPERDA